ncbi:MAG: DEAD/DEAH box helicase [Bacteroidales bacterium]|nr:DEAD/DEAH box helicase [Bacteroidales bacterium]
MNLRTELLPHQAQAVQKVLPTRIGALFMDMGTGKSRTAFELVARRQDRIDHVVYFCPVSLKETVRREILKHTDCADSDICVFNDRTNERNLPKALWYIVGIESMSSSDRVVLATGKLITTRTFVILDESSYIKGAYSMRTMRITRLSEKARYRLILTGTPLSQGVVDLFAQMRFLSPKILGYESFYSFAANHLEYSEKYPGMIVRSHNTEYLAAKVQPYVYQVTKEECLDLPPKLYTTRYFRMTMQQRLAYEAAKDEVFMSLADDDIDSIAIFRLFTFLQEIVCGFWNRRISRGKFEKLEFEHKRIEVLLDIVNSIPAGEKIIIWCKYRYDIEHITEALTGVFGAENVATYHGGLSEKQRNKEEERFHSGARFFVGTPKCAGHGLTLNEAHYGIYYNNDFKYSERLQAEDRCHRIGQAHKVTYIDIQCTDSIDDRIADALAKKGSVVAEFKGEVEKVKDKKGKLKELIKSL